MPRITISIPVELKDQLADARVRRTLNVSRVCQEALRREVRRRLDLPVDLERMDALLRRLRQERQRRDDRWYSEGAAAARDWIEHQAPHDLLKQLGELPAGERLARLSGEPPPALRRFLQDNESEPDFNLQSALEGWAATIGVMWAVIKRNL